MKGFSLLELLIVMAIMGILAAVALPSYQSYTQRARFSEVMLATQPYKTAISMALLEGEQLNDLKSGVLGIPASPAATKNLASLTVDQGTITATATNAAGSYTYILKPDESGSHWSVSGTCLEAGFCKG